MGDYHGPMSATEVRESRFSAPKMGRRGYNMDEVDAFLEIAAARLEGRCGLTATDVEAVRFGRPPIGRRGYREDEVDALLERIAHTLASLPALGLLAEPEPEPAAALADSVLNAADVRNVMFSRPTSRRSKRYREDQVDDFLGAVASRLETGAVLTAAEVREAQFGRPQLGRLGYPADEVDALLTRIAETLDARRG